MPKKKLLEETAKVDTVLSKPKTHSITKTKELKQRITAITAQFTRYQGQGWVNS